VRAVRSTGTQYYSYYYTCHTHQIDTEDSMMAGLNELQAKS
jgi:hypothetical protein